MKSGTRSLKKYIIFPCCLLLFGTIQEVVEYKSLLIDNEYLRVGALMAFYAFGISFIAFFVTPVLEKLVLRLHAASKTGAGWLGEYVFVTVLLGVVYFLWFQILVNGAQTLLPAAWR